MGEILFSPIILNALLAGGAMSLLLGPLGCLVVWRRMAYFGDAIAHGALLGVALSLLCTLPLTAAIFITALVMGCVMTAWMKDVRFHADTLLGFLAHGMLAVGLVAVAMSDHTAGDLEAYLFGDILAISRTEILTMAALVSVGLIVIIRNWDALVLTTLEPNLARVEGIAVMRLNYILVAVLALLVALAIKMVGVLLITALLIMPAAAARPVSRSPAQMALFAVCFSMVAIAGGIVSAVAIDAPSGAMIVVVAMCLGVASLVVTSLFHRLKRLF
jgi:zinc transport system permease protein